MPELGKALTPTYLERVQAASDSCMSPHTKNVFET